MTYQEAQAYLRSQTAALAALAMEVYENAKAHGFYDKPFYLGEKLMLIVSEDSEALEEYRDGHGLDEVYFKGETNKPEGVPVEMADVIIRTLDLWVAALHFIPEEAVDGASTTGNINAMLTQTADEVPALEEGFNPAAAMMFVPRFASEAQTEHEAGVSIAASLSRIILGAINFMLWSSVPDPMAVVRQKMDYNKTRPYKHGGKLI